MNRLRATEIAAHTASLLAVVATIFVVSVVPGAEANPVSAAIIAEVGLLGWALATQVAVGTIFASLRWAREQHESADDRLRTEHLGALVAVPLALDAVGNAVAIATHATEWSVHWETLALDAGAVALLAAVLVVRPDPRLVLDELLSTVRGVTSRLSKPDLSAARSVLLVAMLVLAAVSGAVTLGPLPAADRASAAGQVIDDLETGDLSEWSPTTSGAKDSFAVTSAAAFEGSYGLDASADSSGYDIDHSLPTNPDSFSTYIRIENYNSGSTPSLFQLVSSANDQALSFDTDGSGTIRYYNSGWTSTGVTLSENTWYRFEIANMDSTPELKLYDTDGNLVSSATLSYQQTSTVEKIRLQDRAYVHLDYLTVNGKKLGQPVSGTVTNSGGKGISDATVEIRQSGGVIKSTTTNSTGGYSFSGVSDGDYSIRASASGYQNRSKSITVSGSPKTVDFSLLGSTLVKVRDQSGDPVSYATVQAVAWNNSSFTGTRQEIQNRIDTLEKDISNPLPDSWKGRDYDIRAKRFAKTNERYVALHRAEDWKTSSSPALVYETDLTITNNKVHANIQPVGQVEGDPRLKRPKLVFSPDERIWVSCWDGSVGGLQNGVDNDLPGAAVNCNANITQLAGSDSLAAPITVETKQVWSALGPGGDEYAGVVKADALGPGVYRVEPASGNGVAYTFAIAPNRDPSAIARNIVTELQNQKGKLTDKAQELQDLAQQDKLQVKRVQTGKYGRARIALDKGNVARVTAIAYKRPAGFDASDFSDLQVSGTYPTQQDITRWYELKTDAFRSNLEQGNEEFASLRCNGISNATGSTAVPAGVASGRPPTSITVEVQTVGRPGYLPSTDKLCAQADLVDFLESQGLSDQIPGILQSVEDMSPQEIREAYKQASNLIAENAEACKAALRERGFQDLSECTAGPNGTPDPGSDGYLNNGTDVTPGTPPGGYPMPDAPDVNVDTNVDLGTVSDALQDTQQSVDQLQDTIDSGSPTSSVGAGNETVSMSFPFDTDLSPGQVVMRVNYANGSTTYLNTSSQYLSIEEGIGGDTVRLVDYPLGQSAAAVANFRVNVATPDGTGSASKAVRNPTYTGTIPQLSSLRVSSLTPGVNETVQVGVNGKPGSGFGATEAVRVTYPNGTTTTLAGTTDGQANFTAVAPGTHRIQAVFSPAGGGQNFTETVLVTASRTDVPRPPSIRPQEGPTGRYTIVSQAYADGSIETDANGKRIEIRGNVRSQSDVPDSTHLYLSGVDRAPKSTISYRMTQGPDQQAVTQSSRVVLHLGSLSDNAIVYRGGAPLKVGGETPAGVLKKANGTWTLSTYTGENGQVEVTVNNDPRLDQRLGYWVDLLLATGSLPFLAVGLPVPYHPATGLLGWLVLIGVPSGSAVGLKRRWVDD